MRVLSCECHSIFKSRIDMGSQDDSDWAKKKKKMLGKMPMKCGMNPEIQEKILSLGPMVCLISIHSLEAFHLIAVVYKVAWGLCLLPCVDVEMLQDQMKYFIPSFRN